MKNAEISEISDKSQARISTIVVSVDRLSIMRAKAASEYSDVSSPEWCITKCVEHRVDGRIDVAQVVGPLPDGIEDHIFLKLPGENRLNKNQDTVR